MIKKSLSHRYRRLRRNANVRNWVRETELRADDFILPLFVKPGRSQRLPIPSMPGQYQLSIDELVVEVAHAVSFGIPAVLLFGLPAKKDIRASDAYAANGIVQQAVRVLKKKFPHLIVITDLCFCEYMTHGHCGIVRKGKNGSADVDNDATLGLIRKTAAAQARAGADFIAPSGMMDGTVAVIRDELDKKNFKDVGILGYSAKYASVFYGPFRDAADSTPQFGDRKTYQMDPGNAREALKEIERDVHEGADMVMVKPALSYLDVLAKAKSSLRIPLVAYNVSGEYAMVKAAEKQGWLNGLKTAWEILTSIKRAGADRIITYHALEVARLLKQQKK